MDKTYDKPSITKLGSLNDVVQAQFLGRRLDSGPFQGSIVGDGITPVPSAAPVLSM